GMIDWTCTAYESPVAQSTSTPDGRVAVVSQAPLTSKIIGHGCYQLATNDFALGGKLNFNKGGCSSNSFAYGPNTLLQACVGRFCALLSPGQFEMHRGPRW